MIVKIKFSEDVTMMFGESYKPWHMQFSEWFWWYKKKDINLISVETTSSKWIGWGGLKWCEETMFQDQLDREGCQEDDSDNPNPRQYNQMKFKNNAVVIAKVRKIIRDYKRESSNTL